MMVMPLFCPFSCRKTNLEYCLFETEKRCAVSNTYYACIIVVLNLGTLIEFLKVFADGKIVFNYLVKVGRSKDSGDKGIFFKKFDAVISWEKEYMEIKIL